MGNIKSGVLRPLAVTSLKRIAALPDLPTASEGGLPGFEAAQRYGLIAPAGLPPASPQSFPRRCARHSPPTR